MEYRVKEIRESAGITQEDLAMKSGVSRTIISGLESGTIKETSTRTLRKIADALGKSKRVIFLIVVSNMLNTWTRIMEVRQCHQ